MSVAWKKILDKLLSLQKGLLEDSVSDSEKSDALSLIAELVESRADSTVIHLLSFLVSKDDEIAAAASTAIKKLMSKMTAAELLHLEERVRGSRYYTRNYREAWDKQPKDSIVSLLKRDSQPVLMLGLGSMHGNGYIRERCVYELDKIKDGSELPFLLIRTTDWVEEIRIPAKSAIQSRLKKENAGFFVQNIALIDKLKLRKRGDAARVLRLSHELAIDAPFKDFVSQLSSFDLQARRLCIYLGLARQDRIQIIEQGLDNSDHQVRQIAYMTAMPQLAAEQKLEVLKKGLKDPFPSNRREMLRMVAQHFPDRFDEFIFPALMDQTTRVRTLARFLWKEKYPDFDFRKFYCERLEASLPAEICPAMRGLSDNAQIEDYSIIEKFSSNKILKIRKTAIDCLLAINKERSVELLLKILAEEEPGMASTAKKNLKLCNRFLSGEDLWRVFSTCKQLSTKQTVIQLLAELPKWEQLGYLLIAYANKNEAISKLALNYLKRWQDRFRQSWVFSQPNKTQAERIRLAASLVAARLDIPKYRELQLVFESLKITVID